MGFVSRGWTSLCWAVGLGYIICVGFYSLLYVLFIV